MLRLRIRYVTGRETPRRGGSLALIAVMAGFGLSACASPSTPGVATGSTTATSTVVNSSDHGSTSASGLLAFSSCVRSHGVPKFPDPASIGGIPKETAQQLGVNQSKLQAAESDCTHLLLAGGTLSGTNKPNDHGRAKAVLPQGNCLYALTRCQQLPRTELLWRLRRVSGARTSSGCRLAAVQACLRHMPNAHSCGPPVRQRVKRITLAD